MKVLSSFRVRQIVALLLIFIISILHGEARCQEKSSPKGNSIPSVKIDPQSGKRWTNPKEGMITGKENSSKAKFDQQRFDKELNTLKKISAKQELLKRLYESRVKAEQDSSGKKVSAIQELERIKLFDRATPFYKSPAAPKPIRNSFLSKNLVTNVLVNGKTHDTISVNDPIVLTFSSAPNYVSAIVNIYIDANQNGIVSPGDLPIISNGLMMDNSESDEDQTEGSFKVTFAEENNYSSIVSSLIFEVNDYQSISSAVVTVEQRTGNAVIIGTLAPRLTNLMMFASINPSEIVIVPSDSTGKFIINVDTNKTQQILLQALDLNGTSNGYLLPDQKVVNILSNTTNVNFTLEPATSFIEGYVKDQYGTVIKNSTVEAYGSSFQRFQTQTDSSGHYKLGLIPGMWDVNALVPGSADYLLNSYSPWTFVGNFNTIEHDIVLLKANSTISGKVLLNTNGAGGIPIQTTSDSLENFVLSSADGNYELPVYKHSSRTIYYNLTTYVPLGYYIVNPYQYSISPGATNINFEIKKVTGGIHGKITDSKTGEPIPNASINVSGISDYRNVRSNDSGYYRITLQDGVYYLQVSVPNYYTYTYNNISVSGAMVTKNFSLVKSGSFSGSVKNKENKPLYNATITSVDTSGYPLGSYGSTDENGNYTVSMLKTAKYGAYLYAYGYVPQWYNQVYEKDSATFFQVIEGNETPNIDFVLSKGGSISGRVIDKSGIGIPWVRISVFDTLHGNGSYATTNDSGYYSATGLVPGKYFVETYGHQRYADQYYDGATTLATALPVHVDLDQITPNINFTLSLSSSISGYVKDKNNIRVPYAQVAILDSSFNIVNYFYANDSGYYFAGRLSAGNKYYVNAQGYGYAQKWYNNVSSTDSATPITLQPEEQRENINFVLSKAGSISGVVKNLSCSTIPYISISLIDNNGNYFTYGYTDAQGKYTISNLPNGKYYAQINETLYEEQWFDHKSSIYEADPINVVEDKTTENINFDLKKPGEIPCDSIIIKVELAEIPYSLTFSPTYVSNYYCDYFWSVLFDVDGSDSTGRDGCELEVSLNHYKQPGDFPHVSDMINGTTHVVMEWIGSSGYTRHANFSVRKDELNKNTMVISLPKTWDEINKINSTTKYFVETFCWASNGSFFDYSKIGNGTENITDQKSDVPYNYIDIVSASWKPKSLVSISEKEMIPETYSLSQNFPNPFNPTTTIAYALPVDSKVTLTLYNMLGEVVLINDVGVKASGNHQLQMDLNSKASGVYFYEMEANHVDGSKNFRQIKKMILMK